MSGYADVFEAYRKAGWPSVLPLPARQKKHPPVGYTGREAKIPSYPDMYSWAEEMPDGNVCLRLPENVIGIDVDHYDGKDGGGTLQRHIDQFGELPATWITGSRTDGVSGIRLYRVPVGLQWPGDLGGGIEIIQSRHRYAIVWPSIHPKTGQTYNWRTESTAAGLQTIPSVEDLAELPDAWVAGLTGGLTAKNIQAADLAHPEAVKWLQDHGQGTQCRQVEQAVNGYINELASGARSRHEVGKDATMRLAHMSAEGHRGTFTALATVRAAFLQALHGTDRAGEGPEEFNRLLLGAVRIAAMDTIETADPCDNSFHGILEAAPASPSSIIGPTPAKAPAVTPAGSVDTDEPTEADLLGLIDPDGSTSLPPAPAAAATETEPVQPPSWAPVDLGPFLDGSWEPEQPTMLKRTDGRFLIYPGLVHDFHGESESGKSLVAQALCAELMLQGQQVVYLDFESGPGPVAGRMMSLGVHPEILRALFTYIRPEVNPYALAEVDAFRDLLTTRPALVIIDGVTDALVQSGVGSKENDEITRWHRAVPRMITNRTGAALILIDHVSKDAERGRFAIGGSAKMATIDGASYTVEMVEPIGRGLRGSVVLRIGKDRPGTIRPHCGQWRAKDRTQEAATMVIDSTADPNRILFTLVPPASSVHHGVDEGGDGDYRHPVKVSRPTVLMERISRWMESHEPEEGLPAVTLERTEGLASKANAAAMKRAVAALREEGYLVEEHRRLKLATYYRQHLDPESDKFTGGSTTSEAATRAFLNL